MVERIKNICKERKIPISKLEQDLDFGNGYITSLKKGTVPADRLYTIAKYLNLSMEYLITGTESKEYFSPEEKKLIEQFRTLPIESLKEIQKFVEFQIYKSKGE